MTEHHIDVANLTRSSAMQRDSDAADDPPGLVGVLQESCKTRETVLNRTSNDQSGFFATPTKAGRNNRSFIM